jgi:ankyrin repeat protein
MSKWIHDRNWKHIRSTAKRGAETETKLTSSHLFYAIEQDAPVDIVQLFVTLHPAFLRSKNNQSQTPLLFAAQLGRTHIVKYLDTVSDIEAGDYRGAQVLHLAAENNHLATLTYLVDTYPTRINVTDNYGNTPLYVASEKGHVAIVLFLLTRGAEVDHANRDGWTPLHIAIVHNHVTTVKILVQHGAYPFDKSLGYDALTTASLPPMLSNIEGSAIQMAVYHDRLAIVKYLVQRGVNIETETDNGETPLLSAVIHDKMSIVRYLVEHGADVDHADSQRGMTPLHMAVMYRNLPMVRYLIDHGANIFSKDIEGQTAEDVANMEIEANTGDEDQLGRDIYEYVKNARVKRERRNLSQLFSQIPRLNTKDTKYAVSRFLGGNFP